MGNPYPQDDFFKIDVEMHLTGDITPVKHFPGVQMWWKAVPSLNRFFREGMPPTDVPGEDELVKQGPERIIEFMDKYGIDIGCLLPESMMDTTGHSSRWCTNGEMAKVVEANPDRFLYQPNLSPIRYRGVKAAIQELEYWVKEKNARIFKYYPPEDTYLNDRELWPFYEKAQELGIILDIHTGMVWVPPGKSQYCKPALLEDVARDFPDLKIVAFHMGYPHCDEMNIIAMGYPNIYLSLSLLVPWALVAPRKFATVLGEALRCVPSERIVWGTDFVGMGLQFYQAVEGLRSFQFPEDMQAGYGYPELTDQDRKNIFGENMARLLGIDTSVRRVKKQTKRGEFCEFL